MMLSLSIFLSVLCAVSLADGATLVQPRGEALLRGFARRNPNAVPKMFPDRRKVRQVTGTLSAVKHRDSALVERISLQSLLKVTGYIPPVLADQVTVDLLNLTLSAEPKALNENSIQLVFDWDKGGLVKMESEGIDTTPGELFKSICQNYLAKLRLEGAPEECNHPWSAQAVKVLRLHLLIEMEKMEKDYINMMWGMLIRTYRNDSDENLDILGLAYNHEYLDILRGMDARKKMSLQSMIAEGGFGKVWRSFMDDKLYATKIINLQKRDIDLPLTLHELWALRKVEGLRNVVQMIRAQMISPTEMAVIMEYLDGIEGSDLLLNHPEVKPGLLGAILRELIIGLQGIHSRNMIHSDLKWQNIYLGVDGRVTIIDLGLAVPIGHPLLGTTDVYAPAEYFDEDDYVADFSFDIYQLGMMLLTALNYYGGRVESYSHPWEDIILGEYSTKGLDLEQIAMVEFMRLSMLDQATLESLLETDFIMSAWGPKKLRGWLENNVSEIRMKKPVRH